MRRKHKVDLLGGIDAKSIVKISGKTFYIKLLSVYEALLCESMSSELLEKLTQEDDIDKRLAKSVTENASLASMCVYNKQGKKMFENGFDALSKLTPDELLVVASEYNELKDKNFSFSKLNEKTFELLKKN